MKNIMILVIVVLMSALTAVAGNNSVQCKATTKSGQQCKNKTTDASGLCRIHNPNYQAADKVKTKQCSATTKSGQQCRLMTSNPSGKCHIHDKK